jgi:hypothetical protein
MALSLPCAPVPARQIAQAGRPSAADCVRCGHPEPRSVRVLSIEMDVDLTSWMSVRGTRRETVHRPIAGVSTDDQAVSDADCQTATFRSVSDRLTGIGGMTRVASVPSCLSA